MVTIDFNKLNPLETKIHRTIAEASTALKSISINEAADLSECSVSKISKFVKKLGFSSYKQYMSFIYGRDPSEKSVSDELKRVRDFIEDFDDASVEELFSLIERHDKVVLFGYGPSLLCAQYFEYRFRNCSQKTTMALSDEVALKNMVNASTLLIIITETGQFHSFETVYRTARDKGCTVVIIAEEYNRSLFDQCDRLFWLAPQPQPSRLMPYEKSRTLFFIYLEEVIQKILKQGED